MQFMKDTTISKADCSAFVFSQQTFSRLQMQLTSVYVWGGGGWRLKGLIICIVGNINNCVKMFVAL